MCSMTATQTQHMVHFHTTKTSGQVLWYLTSIFQLEGEEIQKPYELTVDNVGVPQLEWLRLLWSQASFAHPCKVKNLLFAGPNSLVSPDSLWCFCEFCNPHLGMFLVFRDKLPVLKWAEYQSLFFQRRLLQGQSLFWPYFRVSVGKVED